MFGRTARDGQPLAISCLLCALAGLPSPAFTPGCGCQPAPCLRPESTTLGATRLKTIYAFLSHFRPWFVALLRANSIRTVTDKRRHRPRLDHAPHTAYCLRRNRRHWPMLADHLHHSPHRPRASRRQNAERAGLSRRANADRGANQKVTHHAQPSSGEPPGRFITPRRCLSSMASAGVRSSHRATALPWLRATGRPAVEPPGRLSQSRLRRRCMNRYPHATGLQEANNKISQKSFSPLNSRRKLQLF